MSDYKEDMNVRVRLVEPDEHDGDGPALAIETREGKYHQFQVDYLLTDYKQLLTTVLGGVEHADDVDRAQLVRLALAGVSDMRSIVPILEALKAVVHAQQRVSDQEYRGEWTEVSEGVHLALYHLRRLGLRELMGDE